MGATGATSGGWDWPNTSQQSYISSLSVSFISVSPQLCFSSLFPISGLFLSILVLSTPLLRLTIYVEALQFVLHPLEPPIRFPIPLHCSLSSPQLPTCIGYTSPPHRSGGYVLHSTPPGPSIRSTQAPQLPLLRLPSPVSALSHTSLYGLGGYCIRLGPVWVRPEQAFCAGASHVAYKGYWLRPPSLQYAAHFVFVIESQLADSQWENSSLTTALRDTSHALDARQREVEQLWSSSTRPSIVAWWTSSVHWTGPYRGFLTVVQRFQALEEELRIVKRDHDVTLGEFSTASRKSSELKTTLMQGLVDETNALATRQHRCLEELREEIHHTHDCATFVEQMIKEYPDKGFYKVVLPPLSQLEEDLKRANEDIRHIATFAHRLYHSDPAMVLHHHSRYIGAIIEALALDYMQTAWGIHGDLYMRSVSSIGWFFNNAVDEDEGLHHLVLEHSRFVMPRPEFHSPSAP
ncbi:hypothetical protein GG344DRAFT_76695 [Lentinula edodes]|nr:hypothetical protein GG344DRAFT_76695 [Lentinula edodes]